MSFAGLPKHIFSHTHFHHLREAVIRSKSSILSWIAEYEAGKKSLQKPLPTISFSDKDTNRYRVCFSCKKISISGSNKEHRCDTNAKKWEEKRKECVDEYKTILAEAKDIPLTQPQESLTETVTDPDLIYSLKNHQADLKTLTKKAEALQGIIDSNEEVVEKADQYRESLRYVLNYTKCDNFELYERILTNLKEEFPEVQGEFC